MSAPDERSWPKSLINKHARFRKKHWRVQRSPGFSFHSDRRFYYLEYKGWFGIWWGLDGGFESNESAVSFAKELAPLSIEECDLPIIMKPEDWNMKMALTGKYGKQFQQRALNQLVDRSRQQQNQTGESHGT